MLCLQFTPTWQEMTYFRILIKSILHNRLFSWWLEFLCDFIFSVFRCMLRPLIKNYMKITMFRTNTDIIKQLILKNSWITHKVNLLYNIDGNFINGYTKCCIHWNNNDCVDSYKIINQVKYLSELKWQLHKKCMVQSL